MVSHIKVKLVMPNGVSCAYFAAKNHMYGQKENNIFREGIAGAQTTRAVDTVLRVGKSQFPVLSSASHFFDKAASLAKQIVYPLIVMAGVYKTAKSDDKVRTGFSQASGIATMYTFESIAEKGLDYLNKKMRPTTKSNKAAKVGWYILKGSAFVVASMSGWNLGNKSGELLVDTVRLHSNSNKDLVFDADKELKHKSKEDIFADMQL